MKEREFYSEISLKLITILRSSATNSFSIKFSETSTRITKPTRTQKKRDQYYEQHIERLKSTLAETREHNMKLQTENEKLNEEILYLKNKYAEFEEEQIDVVPSPEKQENK
eukprot:gene12585-6405_t